MLVPHNHPSRGDPWPLRYSTALSTRAPAAADGLDLELPTTVNRRRLPSWLPKGGSLPEADWQARHRWVTALLWVHLFAIPLYAIYRGSSVGHALFEALPVLLAIILASSRELGRTARSSVAALGLMLCSGVIVHLSGGLIEAHFHFFVMIPVVALYEAWLPFALGVAYVLVHHGIMGTLDPRSVYNHPAAWERPWLFAAAHAAFFATACIACIVNWWLHERARDTSQAQSQLLSTIVDSLRDGLVVIDANGEILLRNPAGVSLMGGVHLGRPERGSRAAVRAVPPRRRAGGTPGAAPRAGAGQPPGPRCRPRGPQHRRAAGQGAELLGHSAAAQRCRGRPSGGGALP